MRFNLTILPILFAVLATSRSLSPFGNSETPLVIEAGGSVPGANPLTFCTDKSGYILTIERVDLNPNPPKPGLTLKIEASGVFSKDVEKGAYVSLQVKYGLITLIRQTVDLCEQIESVDLKCPLKKGPMTFTKEVEIPSQVPQGTYKVFANVMSVDEEEITCLESTVHL